jgi:hypothetical protein
VSSIRVHSVGDGTLGARVDESMTAGEWLYSPTRDQTAGAYVTRDVTCREDASARILAMGSPADKDVARLFHDVVKIEAFYGFYEASERAPK